MTDIMNKITAKKRAHSETWTWTHLRLILATAQSQLSGRTSRVNPSVFTDRDVWDILDKAVGDRTGEVSGHYLIIVQNTLREFGD